MKKGLILNENVDKNRTNCHRIFENLLLFVIIMWNIRENLGNGK